jgi:hypothetical protein
MEAGATGETEPREQSLQTEEAKPVRSGFVARVVLKRQRINKVYLP